MAGKRTDPTVQSIARGQGSAANSEPSIDIDEQGRRNTFSSIFGGAVAHKNTPTLWENIVGLFPGHDAQSLADLRASRQAQADSVKSAAAAADARAADHAAKMQKALDEMRSEFPSVPTAPPAQNGKK